MKPKSIAGLGCYVKDINKTAAFYEALGFTTTDRKPNFLAVRLNWFWIEFIAQDSEEKTEFQKDAGADYKGAGLYINVNVEDVDDFYTGAIEKGLQPSSEPKDWPYGRREFVIRDPDGYKLVFFQKMK